MNEHIIDSSLISRRDTNKRLVHIDALRTIAALSVLFVHIAVYLAKQPDAPWMAVLFKEVVLDQFDLGIFGVALFFFISGFVVPFSLIAGNGLREFWLHRVFRLYPPFWISLLAVVATEGLLQGRTFLPSQVFANVTMVPQLFGIQPMNGIYWTLFVEMVFYIICSILYVFGFLGKLRVTVLVVILLASITAIPVFLNEIIGTHLPVKYLALHLSFLFSGSLVRLCLYGNSPSRNGLLFTVLTIQIVLCALATGLFFEGPPGFGFFTRHAIFLAYVAAGICFLWSVTTRAPTNALLVRLGASSYSLYLLHWPAIVVVLAVLPNGASQFSLLLILFGTLLSLLLAEGSYRVFERPCIRAGKAIGARFFKTPPAWSR